MKHPLDAQIDTGGQDRMLRHLAERAAALRAVSDFFERRGSLPVETPYVVPSPGLDLHLDAFEVRTSVSAKHTGFLITSPEYHMKRLLAEGLKAIHQVARCFRDGEVGRWHNPEFVMIEWYRSGCTYVHLMDETEALVRHVAEALGGELRLGPRPLCLAGPFDRLSVAEAWQTYADLSEAKVLDMAEHDEDTYFYRWVDEIEPRLAERDRPLFVYDFPSTQASLARRKPDRPRLCERFELYAGGIELCNGFGELTDPVEQRQRLEKDRATRQKAGKPVYPIDEPFLQALEAGLAPCSGNALGFDRLLALCVGATSIGDVMAFPHARV